MISIKSNDGQVVALLTMSEYLAISSEQISVLSNQGK
jgi:hypothetical protein